MSAKTYVYDGQEVQLTGRVAKRKLRTTSGKEIESRLVEITPVGEESGWKKWINPEQLYTVSSDGDSS